MPVTCSSTLQADFILQIAPVLTPDFLAGPAVANVLDLGEREGLQGAQALLEACIFLSRWPNQTNMIKMPILQIELYQDHICHMSSRGINLRLKSDSCLFKFYFIFCGHVFRICQTGSRRDMCLKAINRDYVSWLSVSRQALVPMHWHNPNLVLCLGSVNVIMHMAHMHFPLVLDHDHLDC